MLLNSLLAALRVSRETPERKAAYEEFLQRLDQAQVAGQALQAGAPMPPFLLPNAEGTLVGTDELLRRGPLVVTFFRGNWCPYCVATLNALESALPAIRDAGVTLLALTPETGGLALATKAAQRLSYEVLVDVDLAVAMQFGIVFRTPPRYAALLSRVGIDLAGRSGNPGWLLPIPATFLVGTDGVVRQAWVNVDFTVRAEPTEVVAAVRALGRQGATA